MHSHARISSALLLSSVLLQLGCGGAPTSESTSPARAIVDDSIGIPNERHLEDANMQGSLITGGPPDAAALERAHALGVTMVVTLRLTSEAGFDAEQAKVEEMGMQFMSIPIDGALGLTEENARSVDEALRSADGDVLLHCGSGNRAGATLALRAFYVEDKSQNEAMQIGRAAGLTGLESAVRENMEAACGIVEPPAGCSRRR